MLKFFINRTVTTIVFVLFFVVLGIVSLPKMNIEKTPPVEFPFVTVTLVYPGASSFEIETQVIKKAEDKISEVAGLKKITSQIFENAGFIIAEFNLGANVDDKANEVKAKIDSLANDFPKDLKKPVIEKLDPLQQSVIDLVVKGKDTKKIKRYIEETLSNKITSIKGIASVNVFGGKTRAIKISVNPELMTMNGVTILDVITAVASSNLNIPSGKIETDVNSKNVRFIGEFDNIEQIANLKITTAEGYVFKIKDIASVSDSVKDLENGARFNGEDVVILSVIKASDGNAIQISKTLNKKLPEFQKALQSQFKDATIDIVYDSSIDIVDETNSTIYSILLGILFTVIILFMFTKNIQSTFIAGIVIPASLLSGFFLINNKGFSINVMTLLAYATALGTLVSNAIILIESSLSELKKGKDPKQAAEDGTKKVFVPVLAGVGTNVVVFLPLAFMGGIAGQFMLQFGLTVVYLTVFSLIFSFTLTPMMIAKFLRYKDMPKQKKNEISSLNTYIKKVYNYQLSHPIRMILGAFVFLIFSALLMNFIGSEFQPSTDTGIIQITAKAPNGSVYKKSENIAQKIENKLKDIKEIKSVIVKIGERGLQNINIKINLVEHKKRKLTDKQITKKIILLLSEIPDVELQIKAGESMAGANSADLVLNVYGDDDKQREMYANKIISLINDIEEVQSVVLAQQKPAGEIRFIPNQSKMSSWGIKNSQAGLALRTSLFGNEDYSYKEDGYEYPIIISLDQEFKTKEIFNNIYVNSHKGMIALSDLGSLENATSTSDIYRINKNRITEININLGKSTIGPVRKKIEKKLQSINFEQGYSASFSGMAEIQDETNGEIGQAFFLATILTFMLLAAIMNSFIHPFTIITSILTSFSGVFIILFLSGASMNIGAMLAFVMLVGLVVNNNILVLEPTVARVQKGEDAKKVLIEELLDKKRMMLMTTIAIIAGMVPQLFENDGLKVAMGAVMIGGMLASLIWTFVLTPSIFLTVENIKKKLKRKWKI